MSKRIRCTIYRTNEVPYELNDLAFISDELEKKNCFLWLDITQPQISDFELLQEEFKLHPLAVEDALKAHQRSKIEAYGDLWFLVLHGVYQNNNELTTYEIALFVGEHFIITVRANPAYALGEVERRWTGKPLKLVSNSSVLLFALLDTIVDGYLTIAERFNKEAEALEVALLGEVSRTNDVLIDLFATRKEISRFRNAVSPLHTIIGPIIRGQLPFASAEVLLYFRDVEDHVTRTLESIDGTRDFLNNARETHIALVSYHQSEISKQLALVATIFLPLTFITGFFGQNFSYLVTTITSANTFWIFGVGVEIAAVAILLLYFRYRKWR